MLIIPLVTVIKREKEKNRNFKTKNDDGSGGTPKILNPKEAYWYHSVKALTL